MPNNIPLKGSMTFLYTSVDEYLICSHFMDVMNDAMKHPSTIIAICRDYCIVQFVILLQFAPALTLRSLIHPD